MQWDIRLVAAIVPALVVGVLFETFLGHRHDYTGHYAAGYGATFGALMVALKSVPLSKYERFSIPCVAAICPVCIFLGVITEATLFRIAKFDEVDFFNQSLGAVLAAMSAIPYLARIKPADAIFDRGLILAIVFLSAGCCFAVA